MLNKTKSTRSNERTHASDFVTLRFIQHVPEYLCPSIYRRQEKIYGLSAARRLTQRGL